MSKFETKFWVLNGKHIDEFIEKCETSGLGPNSSVSALVLIKAIDAFKEQYQEVTGKELNQSYYVCNQDEPYAGKVLKTILRGEDKKHIKEIPRRK